MIGFLKESQEIRAVIEYHMFYFPPTRRNGDPVQEQAEGEEYPDPREFPGYPAPGSVSGICALHRASKFLIVQEV